MSLSLKSIATGKNALPPRAVLGGVEKIGKSTFASQFPSPIFIPIKGETGLDDIDAAKFPPVSTHAEVLEALDVLGTEEHQFKTCVIDSSSTLDPIVLADAMKREGVDSPAKLGGGYGHQDDTPLEMYREITDRLDALREIRGMGCVIIGHVKTMSFNDPQSENPYDVYEWDLHKKVRSALFRWADCILFCNHKKIIKTADLGFDKKRSVAIDASNGVPKLYTRKRPWHPGGGRGVYGRLPYELDLTYSAFQAAVEAARANDTQENDNG